jgi:hypothetical protein
MSEKLFEALDKGKPEAPPKEVLQELHTQFALTELALMVALKNPISRDCGKDHVDVVEIPACVAKLCLDLVKASTQIVKSAAKS